MRKISFSGVQQLGRALMLPIAVLPAAALLLRFGQADLLNLPFMTSAGAAIFENLGLLFAIGIAVGFAKENNGAAGLAGVVGYFVAIKGAGTLLSIPPEIAADNVLKTAFLLKQASRMSIPVGILSGLSAGLLYNRFHTIRLPDYLSFFGGRRFVPIITGLVGLAWALLFGKTWGVLSTGLDTFSAILSQSGNFGLFIYGALNRLLIVTGLHHIINNVVWFLHGSFTVMQDGVATVVTGDLNRFSRGDHTAGMFMAGFFPVMMFGLPAACLAMYRNALTVNKRAVGGVLLSMALTSFLTGITEPIEFSFMFLAPVLYFIHALLTGLSMVIMNTLDIKLGFGFSAGLIDYVLNFNNATHPWYLIPVGAAYFVIYYLLFDIGIRVFRLKTMGREAPAPDASADTATASASAQGGTPQFSVRTAAIVEALGGSGNLKAIEARATRLYLTVGSNTAIDEAALRRWGARDFARPDAATLEVILGPSAASVAGEMRGMVGLSQSDGGVSSQAAYASTRTASAAADALKDVPGDEKIKAMIMALGGPENLLSVDACTTRLRLEVGNATIDEAKLKSLGARGFVHPDAGTLQVILGPTADTTASEIRDVLHAWSGQEND